MRGRRGADPYDEVSKGVGRFLLLELMYCNTSVLAHWLLARVSKNAGGRPRLASVAFDGRYLGLAL